MALRLEQGVRSTVHHHGGGRHGDDCHTVTNAGFQTVVPLVVGDREQAWVEEAKRRFSGYVIEEVRGGERQKKKNRQVSREGLRKALQVRYENERGEEREATDGWSKEKWEQIGIIL